MIRLRTKANPIHARHKYYSIGGPLIPGRYPRPDGNRVVRLRNYGRRTFIKDIQKFAYGYVIYEKPLSLYDAFTFTLIKAGPYHTPKEDEYIR